MPPMSSVRRAMEPIACSDARAMGTSMSAAYSLSSVTISYTLFWSATSASIESFTRFT